MQTCLVERDLTGINMADLHGVTAAAMRHAANMRADGDRIYCLGSTFLPQEGRCLCLFEAKNAAGGGGVVQGVHCKTGRDGQAWQTWAI